MTVKMTGDGMASLDHTMGEGEVNTEHESIYTYMYDIEYVYIRYTQIYNYLNLLYICII